MNYRPTDFSKLAWTPTPTGGNGKYLVEWPDTGVVVMAYYDGTDECVWASVDPELGVARGCVRLPCFTRWWGPIEQSLKPAKPDSGK